ncbi:hypothetical protein C9J12_21375 [Photobacterium frigidiphilum]|uniref:Uncharacterized protein n=1 Tax=Photobacterium frigidiphilum TaxID=264736 RepID=A0A2T3JAE9_9GAMM|nr:hypothetical protein [Photobacterium frigidiphilum]PSU45793.1 hypothetical protein C9J12_21375 [Photobacterium frigidiphilum]
MKTIKVIGLLSLLASSFVSANNTIIFSGSYHHENVPITYPKTQHPISLVGGYNITNGILSSNTYNCGIDVSDYNMTTTLQWEATKPLLVVLGDNLIMCRSGSTGPFELDLTQFIESTPPHILDHLEVANSYPFN